MDPCPGVSSCTHCRTPSQCFLGDRIYPSRILVPTKQLSKLTQKLRHSQRSQHRKSPAGCLLKYWHPQRMMPVTTCTIKNMDGASFSKLLLVNMTLWFCIFVYSAILLSSLSAGFLGYLCRRIMYIIRKQQQCKCFCFSFPILLLIVSLFLSYYTGWKLQYTEQEQAQQESLSSSSTTETIP